MTFILLCSISCAEAWNGLARDFAPYKVSEQHAAVRVQVAKDALAPDVADRLADRALAEFDHGPECDGLVIQGNINQWSPVGVDADEKFLSHKDHQLLTAAFDAIVHSPALIDCVNHYSGGCGGRIFAFAVLDRQQAQWEHFDWVLRHCLSVLVSLSDELTPTLVNGSEDLASLMEALYATTDKWAEEDGATNLTESAAAQFAPGRTFELEGKLGDWVSNPESVLRNTETYGELSKGDAIAFMRPHAAPEIPVEQRQLVLFLGIFTGPPAFKPVGWPTSALTDYQWHAIMFLTHGHSAADMGKEPLHGRVEHCMRAWVNAFYVKYKLRLPDIARFYSDDCPIPTVSRLLGDEEEKQEEEEEEEERPNPFSVAAFRNAAHGNKPVYMTVSDEVMASEFPLAHDLLSASDDEEFRTRLRTWLPSKTSGKVRPKPVGGKSPGDDDCPIPTVSRLLGDEEEKQEEEEEEEERPNPFSVAAFRNAAHGNKPVYMTVSDEVMASEFPLAHDLLSASDDEEFRTRLRTWLPSKTSGKVRPKPVGGKSPGDDAIVTDVTAAELEGFFFPGDADANRGTVVSCMDVHFPSHHPQSSTSDYLGARHEGRLGLSICATEQSYWEPLHANKLGVWVVASRGVMIWKVSPVDGKGTLIYRQQPGAFVYVPPEVPHSVYTAESFIGVSANYEPSMGNLHGVLAYAKACLPYVAMRVGHGQATARWPRRQPRLHNERAQTPHISSVDPVGQKQNKTWKIQLTWKLQPQHEAAQAAQVEDSEAMRRRKMFAMPALLSVLAPGLNPERVWWGLASSRKGLRLFEESEEAMPSAAAVTEAEEGGSYLLFCWSPLTGVSLDLSRATTNPPGVPPGHSFVACFCKLPLWTVKIHLGAFKSTLARRLALTGMAGMAPSPLAVLPLVRTGGMGTEEANAAVLAQVVRDDVIPVAQTTGETEPGQFSCRVEEGRLRPLLEKTRHAPGLSVYRAPVDVTTAVKQALQGVTTWDFEAAPLLVCRLSHATLQQGFDTRMLLLTLQPWYAFSRIVGSTSEVMRRDLKRTGGVVVYNCASVRIFHNPIAARK